MNWKTSSESYLQEMGISITNNPKKVILLILLVSAFFISNLLL
ncbi:hypothetical protein MNB_SM-4-155 [hydrothermal vent metagenome]|uniref:Uncharacterized protein n=1 Tax=hydrothermal vent metagenome TaxID=652676 RepID=A0A1W1BFZ7_9ZZZZ